MGLTQLGRLGLSDRRHEVPRCLDKLSKLVKVAEGISSFHRLYLRTSDPCTKLQASQEQSPGLSGHLHSLITSSAPSSSPKLRLTCFGLEDSLVDFLSSSSIGLGELCGSIEVV